MTFVLLFLGWTIIVALLIRITMILKHHNNEMDRKLQDKFPWIRNRD